jgi:uncharacterized protein YktA (UPF0223 family)
MSKYIGENQITGAKGVNAFEKYCLDHNPILIWREETKNDFGIDGEIEFTYRTPNGKIAVEGKVIKVQLKSTKLKGYISKENDETFDFIAKDVDVEYWSGHSCDVILVVYFESEEELYARKITREDLNKSRKTQPIAFSKKENKLINGDNSFETKYSKWFKQRVSYNHEEKLFSNLFKFFQLPKFVKVFDSLFSDPRDIFNSLDNSVNIPPFVLKRKKLYSFANLDDFADFKEFVVADNGIVRTENTKYWITDEDNRRIVVQLLNRYIKDYCYKKGVRYSRDYNRYYFKIGPDESIRKERYVSKKGRDTERTVAQRQEYYTPHVRHFAFQTDYVYSDEVLYLVINPKYLFTSDGISPLEDKRLITKLTNYQTARELNQSVINQVYFIFKFLSNNRASLHLSDFTEEEIVVGQPKSFKVPFGIHEDFLGPKGQTSLL